MRNHNTLAQHGREEECGGHGEKAQSHGAKLAASCAVSNDDDGCRNRALDGEGKGI